VWSVRLAKDQSAPRVDKGRDARCACLESFNIIRAALARPIGKQEQIRRNEDGPSSTDASCDSPPLVAGGSRLHLQNLLFCSIEIPHRTSSVSQETPLLSL
jgi:hypothetical protein